MMRKRRETPVTVNLIALPDTTPATLYGLYEVFDAVGRTWGALTGETPEGPRCEVRIVSPDGLPFTTTMGVPIAPHAAFEAASGSDIVIATDLSVPLDADPRGRWPDVADWLRREHAAGAATCSVCTGTILLAEAGLLDDVEATTHWAAKPVFDAFYPQIRLHPERVLSRAGTDGRIITSGGSASWEDLALYLVARYVGEAEAVRISKIFVFGDRSEGQLPYAAMRRGDRHGDTAVAASQVWIAENYAVPNPVARMIAVSGLRERTFKRRFRGATGYTPVDYVQTVRVEEAKQMLERSDLPTDAIAHAVGYEDIAFFRRLFRRKTGVAPARYRQRFQSITTICDG